MMMHPSSVQALVVLTRQTGQLQADTSLKGSFTVHGSCGCVYSPKMRCALNGIVLGVLCMRFLKPLHTCSFYILVYTLHMISA